MKTLDIIGLLVITASIYTIVWTDNKWREEALAHNAAHYVCAKDTGKCEFTWKYLPND